MKCLYCQGKMKKGTAPFHVDRDGYHATLDAVRAWVCVQCGEPYFEALEVQAIQDFTRSLDAKAKKVLTAA